jgi:hypothetical protein
MAVVLNWQAEEVTPNASWTIDLGSQKTFQLKHPHLLVSAATHCSWGRWPDSSLLVGNPEVVLVTRSISGRPVIRPESVVGDYSPVAAFPARAETSSLIPSCLLA